ncbi:MAG: DUF3298 and DUF4163 domain-containing protein [Bacteroidia bacterium]
MKPISMIMLFSLAFFACGPEPKTENEESETNLIEVQWVFDTILVEKEWGDCAATETGCITIALSYPQVREPDSIGKIVNEQIIRLLLGTLRDSFDNMDAYTNHLIQEYKTFSKGAKDAAGWQIENEVRVEYAANQLISVRLESIENFGGASPNLRVGLRSFSQNTGKRLVLADVFKENYEDTLLYLCHYHLKHALTTNLEVTYEDGFLLDREKGFELNEHFLLNEVGISFVYFDPAFQASGAGWQEFTVPYSELIEANILDEKGALGFLLGSVNL